MKLTRRQLKKIIEMAYKGSNPIKQSEKIKRPFLDGHPRFGEYNELDRTTAFGGEMISDNDFETESMKLMKYFASNKFNKDAEKFYGEKVFPGRNVWVVPYIGSEHAAYGEIFLGDVQRGYDNRNNVPGITGLGGGLGNRTLLYPITDTVLGNLGIDKNNVDIANDTIFLPIVSTMINPFFPSVHMIIHAIFDQSIDVPSELSEIGSLLEYISDNYDYFSSLKPETTKSLREKTYQNDTDFAAEIMTGAVLYSGGINNLRFDDTIKEKIKKCVNIFKNQTKGKIVMTTVS